MHCTWCTPSGGGGGGHAPGRGFHGFVLIAIGKMEILATFPHLQDDIKVIRRYQGWYYTKLVIYIIIFYFETDWSRIRPLPSTTLIKINNTINPRPRRRSGGIVLSVSVCRQNSSEPTNIGTLKILPADVKSYKDQFYNYNL